MPRLSRRLTTALLWLALALLPLRGLAATLMPAMGAVPPAASDVAVGAVVELVDADQSMPCHGAAADSHHQEADATPVGDCPTCPLCALCHASVAQATPFRLALPQLPSAPPAAAPPSAIEPSAPDGLFRPPRTLGA
jgi:hypothetical protein